MRVAADGSQTAFGVVVACAAFGVSGWSGDGVAHINIIGRGYEIWKQVQDQHEYFALGSSEHIVLVKVDDGCENMSISVLFASNCE